jgi:uncharacterized protein YjiS (DUF1127 family)
LARAKLFRPAVLRDRAISRKAAHPGRNPSHATSAWQLAPDGRCCHRFHPYFEDRRKDIRSTPVMKRNEMMISVYGTIREAARTYALYRKTRNEIANMPIDVALDLNIYRGDAENIAREAVYGQAA